MPLIKGKFGGFLNWLLRLLQKGKEKGVFDKRPVPPTDGKVEIDMDTFREIK